MSNFDFAEKYYPDIVAKLRVAESTHIKDEYVNNARNAMDDLAKNVLTQETYALVKRP